MADALVAPAVAGTMYICSTAVSAYSVKRVRLESDPGKIPVMGVMGAFVFATQMINFTIPGTGSSGHLCGGMLLSALLGPYAGFLTMIGVLLIQCLLFADGGLLALGCNVWNMAFYGCFAGALLIWKPIMRGGASRAKILLASILGCVLTLQMGAISVALETLASGITELPFGVFVASMQPIHLVIGFVEGLITAAVLLFVYEARPELLYGVGNRRIYTASGVVSAASSAAYTSAAAASEAGSAAYSSGFSMKKTLGILAVVTVLIGGGLSLFASSNPDGLEWALERVTGTSELEAVGGVYDAAASAQEVTALLPDYAFKGSESALGTTFSGIVGSVVVLLVCVGACCAFKFFCRKAKEQKIVSSTK